MIHGVYFTAKARKHASTPAEYGRIPRSQSGATRKGLQVYTNTKLWKKWQVNFATVNRTKRFGCGGQRPTVTVDEGKTRGGSQRLASVWCPVAICLTRFIRKIDLPQMPEQGGVGRRWLRFQNAQIKFIDTSSLLWLLLFICAEEAATDPVVFSWQHFIWLSLHIHSRMSHLPGRATLHSAESEWH